jgi:hypothetical protein
MERGVPYPRGVGLAIAAEIIEMSPDPHRNAFCGDDPKLLIQGSAGNKIQEEIMTYRCKLLIVVSILGALEAVSTNTVSCWISG